MRNTYRYDNSWLIYANSDCDREKCVTPTSYTMPTYPSKEFMDNLPIEIVYNGTIEPIK